MRDTDRSPESPALLGSATFLASAFAFVAIEAVRSARLARAPLAHPPSLFDYAHTAFADFFVTLSFGLVVGGYLFASRSLARRLGAALDGWLGPTLAGLAARGWLELGAPVVFLGWLVTQGTRAWVPNRTLPVLIASSLLASAPAMWLVTFGARTLRRHAARYRHAAVVSALALAAVGAYGYATLSATFGMRYGRSHLVTFGLLVLFLVLVASEALRAWGKRPAGRLTGFAWALGLLGSGALFSISPSPAARELFYVERPTRWFALALAHAGPDADGDGFERPVGFTAGEDCDDRDARRNPGEPEVVANGIDDNCFAGDETRPFGELIAEPSQARETEQPPFNVLVILLDSFRYDPKRFGGVNPELMPTIADFARQSLAFQNYRTCSPRTLESFGDLFFGRLVPTYRGAQRVSAIERLTASGVRTIDISSHFRHEHDNVSGWWKELSVPGKYGDFGDAKSVLETKRMLADAANRPFFVATHLMGAHEPYEPAPKCEPGDSYARYRCALELLDERVGEMLAALSAAGLAETTVVVVSADHGEEFGEHGARFHANTVYDEVLHVPLLVRIPGGRPEAVRESAGCFDFMPTLLGAANRAADPLLVGRDYSREPRPPSGTQFARTRPLGTSGVFEPKTLAVVYRQTKLVVDRQSGVSEYFDLALDPGEASPRARVSPDVERALTERMDGWLSELARQSRRSERVASVRR